MSYTYVNCHKVSWHINCTHRKTHELPADGQGLRSKHVLALINKKNIVQQVGMAYCICNVVAWKMYNIYNGT